MLCSKLNALNFLIFSKPNWDFGERILLFFQIIGQLQGVEGFANVETHN